jgi:phosphonate transport system substrate-binding protein
MSKDFSRWLRGPAIGVLTAWLWITPSAAEDLTFAVHPILSAKETFRVYQPLADYLKKTTGHNVQLATTSNFLVHWQLTKRNIYHLILEGPHMVDYRVSRMGYKLVARMPEIISYSLVSHQDQMVLEPAELVGKPVATMPAPSLGAVHLNQFFPNPLRQPVLIEVNNLEEAMERVMNGQSSGALIPSAMVARYPQVTTVATTPQAPAPGITAAPNVSDEIRRAIAKALVDARDHPEGRAALERLNIPYFEPAAPRHFQGQAKLLEGMWGY